MRSEISAPASSRRIAILAPMASELGPLVAPLGLARRAGQEPGLRWGATRRGVGVVATLTGIGMRAGAQAAAHLLDATSPEHLVVVGIAGGIGASVAVGDLVVPELVLNLDTGERLRPTPLGRAPRRGTLASSDALLADREAAARLAREGVVAIDMETAAIAAVCEQRGCPWSVFRAISDRADDGTTDAAILDLVDETGRPRLAAVARRLLARPQSIPHLVRLARGARAATRAAAAGAVEALDDFGRVGSPEPAAD